MREEKRERETGDGENGKGKGETEKGKGKGKQRKGKGKNKIKRKRKRKKEKYICTRKYALKKFGGRTGQCGLGFCAKPQNFKFFWVTRTGSAFYKIYGQNILFFTFLCKCLHFFYFYFFYLFYFFIKYYFFY